jgi:hypothetical protein
VNAGDEHRAAAPAAAMMIDRMMGFSRQGLGQPRGASAKMNRDGNL